MVKIKGQQAEPDYIWRYFVSHEKYCNWELRQDYTKKQWSCEGVFHELYYTEDELWTSG